MGGDRLRPAAAPNSLTTDEADQESTRRDARRSEEIG